MFKIAYFFADKIEKHQFLHQSLLFLKNLNIFFGYNPYRLHEIVHIKNILLKTGRTFKEIQWINDL